MQTQALICAALTFMHAYSVWTYKYFSFRLMWSDDAMEKIQASPPWMGASGPHAVMSHAPHACTCIHAVGSVGECMLLPMCTHARGHSHTISPTRAHIHQVMPFGSLLDIPAVNMFVFRKFKGGTASVLRYIPMLRSCMQAYRCVQSSCRKGKS